MFPFLKKEALFLFVQEKNSGALVYFSRLISEEAIIEEEFTHYFSIGEKMDFVVLVKSDSYLGFD